MEMILRKLKLKTPLVFTDENIVYSRTAEGNNQRIDEILKTVTKAPVTLEMNKYTWLIDKVEYFEKIIRAGKLQLEDDDIYLKKSQAIYS